MIEIESKFVVHAAAVEMPEHRPWQFGQHLATRTVGVDHGVVRRHGFRQPGALATDDRSRRSTVVLGIWRFEPLVADVRQPGDLARDKVSDCERPGAAGCEWNAAQFVQALPALAEQHANEFVIHNEFVRTETSVTKRERRLAQSGRRLREQ